MKIKKLFGRSCLLIMSALIIGFFQFAGCYKTESGKIEDIIGTYKLVHKTYGRDSSGSAIDILERDDIVEYLVIGEDGKGYRVYGDSETPAYCTEIRYTLEKDDENEGLYKMLRYRTAPTSSETTLGYYKSEQMLNVGTPQIQSGCINIVESSTAYKKVSEDTSLGYLKKSVSANYVFKPYELSALNGPMVAEGNFNQVYPQPEEFTSIPGDYVYFIFELGEDGKTADIYYYTKAGETRCERKNRPLTFELQTTGENAGNITTIMVDEFKFRCWLNGSLSLVVEKSEITYEFYFSGYLSDIDAYIEKAVSDYLAQKESETEQTQKS